MLKHLLTKSMLLLAALTTGSGSAWAEDVTIAEGTFEKTTYTEGWTCTGSGNKTTGCIIVGKGEHIVTPSLDLSGYEKVTISITARRYGSLSGSTATIDASISGVSVGTTEATSTGVIKRDDIQFEPTSAMTNVQIVFTCTNATSAGSTHGAGIGSITITGTPADVNPSQPAAPTFSVPAGTYNTEQSVELSTVTEGASIYYTIDGSKPTTSSTLYSDAIAVNASTTIKAISVKDGVSSATAEAAYVLQVATPMIDPAGGVFEEKQEVAISCATDDATIYYTIDGTTPSDASTAYSAFSLTSTTTVKAIATKTGWTDSEIATATFSKIDLSNAFVKTGLSAIAADDVIAIVGDNGDNYALSNDNGTSAAPTATTVTVVDNMIATVADNLRWNVGGNATDGYVFYKNGDSEHWLYTTNSNNGVRVGVSTDNTFIIKSSYLYNSATKRYIGIYNDSDWRCYTSINANITGQSFAIYKQGISMTLAAACTDGEKYYGTFSSSVPFKFPAGVTVSEIAVVDGKLQMVDYAEGAVVPANTGVLVSSATAGKVTFTPASSTGTSVLGSDNCLKPSGFEITDIETTGNDCTFYRLTMHNGTKLGFWWGAVDGAAFSIAANKAYLAVPTAQAANIQGFVFDDETTGIASIEHATADSGHCYNLSGQRVNTPAKGLYIKNGKKFVVK